MGQVPQAAKSARADVSAKTLAALADACVADAKDVNVGPVLAPFALQGFFRALSNSLSGPVPTAKVNQLAARLSPLLDALSRSGIQDSDRFNRQIDDLLKDLRDVLP